VDIDALEAWIALSHFPAVARLGLFLTVHVLSCIGMEGMLGRLLGPSVNLHLPRLAGCRAKSESLFCSQERHLLSP
jgi:hypothetical protein